ncbi:hypothetical protein IHE55_27160 [Streptomyces pactum]|uniref:DUF4034 domain-containing protein n=1 Tax=Streptomyces pactum TaxID=68249 RepID=A0ABS0NSR9_9ACTN|nr:hypothetical protein [Streptomyces pactum]MBH5338265.1 hypothetical protein [Streptomyces pactum]
MPLFGSRRSAAARLVPELDDTALGRVLAQLQAPPAPGLLDLHVEQAERVIKDTGTDWDRRAHRMTVLARTAPGLNLARAWVQRRGDSTDALAFLSWVELLRRPGSPEEERAAVDRCYRAADLRPEDPTPWVVLLGLLRRLRAPSREVFPVWREVTDRDPWHREAYLQMLGYLSPEECGSQVQVRDFVDAVRSRIPATAPAVGVELTATVLHHHRTVRDGGINAVLAGNQWAHPPASTALENAFEDWTRPGFLRHAAALADLNLLAYVLVHANRTPDAAVVFKMIEGKVTPWPWRLDGDPLERFTHWRERALR